MSPWGMETNEDLYCKATSSYFDIIMGRHKDKKSIEQSKKGDVYIRFLHKLWCMDLLTADGILCNNAVKFKNNRCYVPYIFYTAAVQQRHRQQLHIKSIENPVTSPTVHQLFPPFLPHPTPNLVRRGQTLITKPGLALLDIKISVSRASQP